MGILSLLLLLLLHSHYYELNDPLPLLVYSIIYTFFETSYSFT